MDTPDITAGDSRNPLKGSPGPPSPPTGRHSLESDTAPPTTTASGLRRHVAARDSEREEEEGATSDISVSVMKLSVGTSGATVGDTLSTASGSLDAPVAAVDPILDERLRRERLAGHSVRFNPTILCTLRNLGNTCYFNSGVQILCNCPEFVYAMRDSAFTGEAAGRALVLSRTSSARTHALYRSLTRLLYDMENKAGELGDAISPATALEQLGEVYPAFQGRSQQDCPEMLAAVLGNTEDEGRRDLEVDVLLRGFEAAAATGGDQDARRRRCEPALSPAVRALGGDGTRSAALAAASAAATLTRAISEPFTPLGRGASGARANNGGVARRAAAEERAADREMDARLPPGEEGASGGDGLPLSLPLAGPWSAQSIAALRVMQAVNNNNAALERRSQERKGAACTPASAYRAPRLFSNSATDGFKGYSLSEITCRGCGAVSRVVEPFTSLMLDVPSQRQRARFARRHPGIVRRTESGELPPAKKRASSFCWYNPASYVMDLYHALARLFSPSVDYALTLQECLDIHFGAAELKGSNRYRCETCDRVTEATKRESLLSLPEYLIVHMKRFESGSFFSAKKNDPVVFPISWAPLTSKQAEARTLPAEVNGGRRPEILDLRDYVHPALAAFSAPVPHCLRLEPAASAGGNSNPNNNRNGPATPTPPTLHGHATTTYALNGVVNHHGSLGGGHYTVFVRKTDVDGSEHWVYVNDDVAVAADLSDVAESEEYVLIYRKQPMVALHGAALELRDKARYWLTATSAADDDGATSKRRNSSGSSNSAKHAAATFSSTVYVARPWLQAAAFLADPGPILNKTCYCRTEDRARVASHFGKFPVGSTRVPADAPHVHGPPAEWFYVPIDECDYWAFYTAYGGDVPVTRAEYAAFAAEQERFLGLIRSAAAAGTRGRGN